MLLATFEYHNIDPVIFQLGPLGVRWYGLMYLVGFAFGFFLLKQMKKQELFNIKDDDAIYDTIFYSVLGTMLGGRLGYIFFYGQYSATNHHNQFFQTREGEWHSLYDMFINVIDVTQGGMAFHGAIILGPLVVIYFAWKSKIGIQHLLNVISIALPAGLFFGRIGNFINSELYGAATTSWFGTRFKPDWWGNPNYILYLCREKKFPFLNPEQVHIVYKNELVDGQTKLIYDGFEIARGVSPEQAKIITDRIDVLHLDGLDTATPSLTPKLAELFNLPYYHPSQLYEAFAEGLILFLILWFGRKYFIKKYMAMPFFLIWYGVVRFFIEFVRQADKQMGRNDFLGMTRGQTLCVLMVFVGTLLIFLRPKEDFSFNPIKTSKD